MSRHIEIDGRPLCDWMGSVPLDTLAEYYSTPERRETMSCACSNDNPDKSESDAVALRALGLNAVSVEGDCPGYDLITDVCDGCP